MATRKLQNQARASSTLTFTFDYDFQQNRFIGAFLLNSLVANSV